MNYAEKLEKQNRELRDKLQRLEAVNEKNEYFIYEYLFNDITERLKSNSISVSERKYIKKLLHAIEIIK